MYLTDGIRLLEIVAEDYRLNAGLGGSVIREVAVRDSVTGEMFFMWGAILAKFRKVCEW